MTNAPIATQYVDEKEALIAFADHQRDTFLWKLEGLTEEQVRQSHPPSTMTLLGLLKHCTWVEITWFQHRLLGEPFDKDSHSEAAWNPGADERYEVLLAEYHRAWERSNEIARALPLDATAKIPSEKFGAVTVQWALLHMVEEMARHAGHADLMREAIDGATGTSRPKHQE